MYADNTATLNSGRINLGQQSTMGLMLIAAEELDMDISQFTHIEVDTGGPRPAPDTGNTGGSSSISSGGLFVRAAAVAARQALNNLAATHFGVPVTSLTVDKGVVSAGASTVTYGELIGGSLFNVTYGPGTTSPVKTTSWYMGVSPAKPVADYTQVGIARPQFYDIPSIATGTKLYSVSVVVPEMLHGRVVRPRGQGAYGTGTTPQPLSIDKSSIAHIPNVQIVQAGDFLAVVAPVEYDAIEAAALLKVEWSTPPTITPVGNIYEGMKAQDSAGEVANIVAKPFGPTTPGLAGQLPSIQEAMASAAKTFSGTFHYPYQSHVPIGPNISVADVTPDGAIIYGHVKDAYGTTRPKVVAALNQAAKTLGLPQVYDTTNVRIKFVEAAASFGGGAAHVDNDECSAVCSLVVGKPVRVQWMRWDENGYDNYGPATMWEVEGGIDATGKLVAWNATSFGMGSYAVTPTESMIGTPVTPPGAWGADTTYSGTQYNIPNRVIYGKSLPTLNNYFKVSTIRAPNAPQTLFANEQVIDQLAYVAGMDPYQFRVNNISSAPLGTGTGVASGNPGQWQWLDALNAVAKAANWQPKVANSVKQTGNIRTGRGIALGGFASSQAGNVADIEVNVKTGKIVAKHMYTAVVAGTMVAPRQAESNMMGALVMGTSRAL
ncbi:MAG: molybdopterin cofactor-binding domain-containing protein, partial [Solirubrobacteraceae bacterium]